MVNFLFFNGDKIKEGRAPGNALFEPTSARWNQGNYYTDNPLHGLWKIEDNRVFSNSLFVTGKYAYYNTGFTLELDRAVRPSRWASARCSGQTFGSTNGNYFRRPQHTVNVDGNYFRTFGGKTHDFKFGMGWRRTDIYSQTIYPGNGVVAYENSATDFRARVYREGAGTNRASYMNFYVGDTHRAGPRDARSRRALRPAVGARRCRAQTRSRTRRSRAWCPASTSPATTRRSRGTTSRRASA